MWTKTTFWGFDRMGARPRLDRTQKSSFGPNFDIGEFYDRGGPCARGPAYHSCARGGGARRANSTNLRVHVSNVVAIAIVLLGDHEYSAWCTQRYHFYNSGLALFLAIDHGANRDAYGSLEWTMLLSAHTHRIGVTSVLAHSTAASFFSF